MLNPGDTINSRYTVIKPLGAGAYGNVYLVSGSAGSGEKLALKEIVETELPLDERKEAIKLFNREAEILRTLSHPGLPGIHDCFSVGNSHCIVMEYIDGETLEEKLRARSEPFTWEEVLPWAEELCTILDYLHGRKPDPVIFRDLKPSNIMLTSEGRVKLIDFGIARHFSPRKVKDTYFMGTPGFSPPEQYGMGQSDERSDIFALGATLYRLLTKADLEQYSMKFPPLCSLSPSVPQWLETVIMKCLAVNPGERYQSVSLLLDELQIGQINAGKLKPGQPGAGISFLQAGPGAMPAQSAISSNSGLNVTIAVSLTILAGISIALFLGVKCFFVFLLVTGGCLVYIGYQNGFWKKIGSIFKSQATPVQTPNTASKAAYIIVALIITTVLGLCIFYKSIFGVELWQDSNGVTGLMVFMIVILFLFILIGAGGKSVVVIMVAAVIIILVVVVPFYIQKNVKSRYDLCYSNLKKIGTAMEHYSSDNQGRYPHNLGAITPAYMLTIPTCPAARKITYLYTRTEVPDCYTVWCNGNYHKSAREGRTPEYDTEQGWNDSKEDL